MPNVIAFYLPQFHTIPENDEWWGAGFTDWVNVRKANPIYKEHRQPRVPLNDNYYDLLNEDVFPWQVNLAKKYLVDGFCFYHYWFNGKLLLEKPAENYLDRKNLNLEFCFSWANEPWTRSWDGKNKKILIEQNYNGMTDIVAHIKYLLPFFKDDRYIKIDNKPLFLIYRANSIVYLEEMISVWNSIAKEEGFAGIYFCETLTGFQIEKHSENTDAIVYMEPMWVLGKRNKLMKLLSAKHSPVKLNRIESYDKIWKKILNEEKIGEQTFGGAFVDWDNSPRKKKKNLVFKGSNPAKFQYYFRCQYEKAKKLNSQFIFINAWNEWAEGTYLEPDIFYKTAYLEAVKRVKETET